MDKGIVNLSVIPVRKEASDTSEMITQAIFGELFEVIETKKQWVKVQFLDDSYIGWVDNKQFYHIDSEIFNKIKAAPKYFLAEYISIATQHSTQLPMTLSLGSQLPLYNQGKCILEDDYTIEAEILTGELPKEKIIALAHLYLNTPYLWGGKTVFGIDCSGFTQMVYKLTGIFIPRDAHQQAVLGFPLSFIEEAEPGDLAFFDNPEGKIIHVGIVLSQNRIIHAHGKVRIDLLDSSGIFNQELGKHTHKLRVIKRIIDKC